MPFVLFARALTSFRAIAKAAHQRIGRTLVHLFLLVVLATLATTVSATLVLRKTARQLDPIIDHLPTVTLQGGEASTNVPQPWRRKLEREHGRQTVLVIDTRIDRGELAADEYGLFLSRRYLHLRSNNQERIFSLAQFPDGEYGPPQLHALVKKALAWAPLVIAVACLIWFIIAKTIAAFILVLAALIAGSGRRHKLGFGALFTVATLALTPGVVIDALLTLLRIDPPLFLLMRVALGITWTVLAVRAIPDAPAPSPNSQGDA